MAGRKSGLLVYVSAIVVMAFACVIGGVIYNATGISIDGCRPAPEPDQFISFCNSRKFGDYEHEAFWFGLEPAAIANLKAADVIFTGSSRTMFAFSTSEVRSYFAARGLRQFNLGFSGNDGQIFFTKMALKYHLHPRVLVIGVDPYFNNMVSPPAAAATSDTFGVERALIKKAEIALQPELCRRKILDCDAVGHTAFRSSTDGYFTWRGVLMPDRERQRPHQGMLRTDQVNVTETATAAAKFLDKIGMRPDCVVMAAMPQPQIWLKPDPVKKVADKIGAMYIDADTGDDLAFVDDMHLSYWSAKRFSAEFLRAFDRLPQDCLGQPLAKVATAPAQRNIP